MPDPLSIIRLAALLAFIGLVAVGLWLLDVAWWVVPPVMALALVIAWTIEWLAWRGMLTTSVIRETATSGSTPVPVPPAADEPPMPAEAIVPVAPTAPPPEALREPAPPREPEPPAPAPVTPPVDRAPPRIAEAPPRPEPPAPRPEPPRPKPPRRPDSVPEPLPEPPPEPAPPAAQVPAAPPSEESPFPAAQERRLRRPRRMRLRPVPIPAPSPEPAAPAPPPVQSPVVAFRPRTTVARSWNLWDLERIAREGVRAAPERRDEWAYLFLHLRQFATADGALPTEFDGLVRESFGGLLERAPRA